MNSLKFEGCEGPQGGTTRDSKPDANRPAVTRRKIDSQAKTGERLTKHGKENATRIYTPPFIFRS
jgi:hypothetical protein